MAIVVVGLLLFLPGLGSVHLFDWDEINFAESAREMLVTGDWLNVQINYELFWEKPPLFIWMQALSMKLFGVNEFAARFPNAIAGIITLLVLFRVGLRVGGERFGLLWMGCYLCSFFPFFYFKTGIIDPWFNLFIFLGIYSFSRYGERGLPLTPKWPALSAMFIGLGILTKGPVALLIFGLTFVVYLMWVRFRYAFRWVDVLVYLVVLVFVGGLWFILQILDGHYTILQDFIVYQIRLFQTQDAGHGGFPGYHFVILLFGVFPASFLALPTFRKRVLKDEVLPTLSHLFRWMMICFWVVLILFSMVNTKIIHYSSMCYFPLTFLAAWYLLQLLTGKATLPRWIRVALVVVASLYSVAVMTISLFDHIKPYLLPHINDAFTRGNLEATTTWSGFEPLLGVLFIAASVYFVCSYKHERPMRSLLVLFVGSLFFNFTTMLLVVPQVEKYSQAAAIEFFEERQGEDCYIYPVYYKSYAHYFYSARLPQNNNADQAWLMTGQLDKPCYLVTHDDPSDVAYICTTSPDAVKLYSKNGFAFFVRRPHTPKP